MKWLILGTTVAVVAMAIWILLGERQRARRSNLRGLVATLASLVLFGAIVYAAHYAGFFSLPILAIVFVPIGLGLRWASMLSRDARERREAELPPAPISPAARARELLLLPLFVAMVLGVACLAYAAAVLASIR